MRALWRFLTARWTITLVGAVLIAGLVWYFGPILDVLDAWIPRAAIIAGIFAVWALANFLLDRRRRRADRALTEGVVAISPGEAARAEEVAGLQDALTTALSLLRRAAGTRGYLYEQPWYVIIGPPGAGKTTALRNAGLKFPLAAEMGQGTVATVGGTRLCQWWFTEQAVLIDTAGRYTTQDSDAVVDRAGWEGFLDLLRRTRPRQPLNGVLVAIGAPDIAAAPQSERLAHARAIRRRLKELTERLGLRLPVYALFTKTDLLAGFTEYFDDLDRTQRDQIWGETFPYAPAAVTSPISDWSASLHGLINRVNGRLVDRLQAERSLDRRALLAGFPAQMASLEAPLGEFLIEAFGGSRLDPAPHLRGVYFTSGTQDGTPIDRLTGVLSRSFGLDQRRAPNLRPSQGRSYFVGGLLSLVFNEAMLASTRPGAWRRRQFTRAASFAGIGVVTIGLAVGLLAIRSSQHAAAARMETATAVYEQLAAGVHLDPVTDAALPPIVPLLNAARALPYGEDAPMPLPGLGLSQTRKYANRARLLYHNTLNRVLLPRLLRRLEDQMHARLTEAEFLYEATRIYLMLGGQLGGHGKLDPGLVTGWEAEDWSTEITDPAIRDDLAKHLKTMLAGDLPEVHLDWPLVSDARSTFSRASPAARAYSRIKLSEAAEAIAPWTPASALGASGTQVFYRASGKPLTEGIAGFFTIDGLHKVLLPNLSETAREVAGESWVLGEKAQVSIIGSDFDDLKTKVVKLYTDEYANAWNSMLADLQVHPLGAAEGVSTLYILGSPQSPLRDLLDSISRDLTLSQPPSDLQAEKDAAAKLEAAAGTQKKYAKLLGAGPQSPPPGKAVDDQFAPLRSYVGSGPGAPLELAIKLLSDLQTQLEAASNAGAGTAAPTLAAGGDAAQLLRAEAKRAPAPVNRWLAVISSGSSAARASNVMAAVQSAMGGARALCNAAVNGRYPFTHGAKPEIPLLDFSSLFAPGGQIDSIFKMHIAPFVDMSGGAWTIKPLNGVTLPLSLQQFKRAAAIRDLFFAGGATAPTVRFDISPGYLDGGAKQVTLDLGGVLVTNTHGPPRPTQITWPGTDGMTNVRLSFDPPPESGTGVIEADGAWALFRLIDQARITPGGSPEQFIMSFTLGERQASFHVRAASVFNPFGRDVLPGFRCP